jgi:hypothetical protein
MLYAQFVIAIFGFWLVCYQEFAVQSPVRPGGLYYFHFNPSDRKSFQPSHVINAFKASQQEYYCRAHFNERGGVAWVEIYRREGYSSHHELETRTYFYYHESRLFRKVTARADGRIIRRQEIQNGNVWNYYY